MPVFFRCYFLRLYLKEFCQLIIARAAWLLGIGDGNRALIVMGHIMANTNGNKLNWRMIFDHTRSRIFLGAVQKIVWGLPAEGGVIDRRGRRR